MPFGPRGSRRMQNMEFMRTVVDAIYKHLWLIVAILAVVIFRKELVGILKKRFGRKEKDDAPDGR